MIKAAFLTQHASWPWQRQLPGGHSSFEGVEFFVPLDEAEIVFVYDALPETATRLSYYAKVALKKQAPTVFIASEPKNFKRYNSAFLSQFDAVVTTDRETPHPCRFFVQTGQPWHVGVRSAGGRLLDIPMSFEDFEQHAPRKTKLVSVVSSDKDFTSEHRSRLTFVAKLKETLGDQIDVFGRGINDFMDKRDVLDAYRYHVAIENCAIEDHWTEKLADPYLTLTFPIYHGCPNIADYFSEKALRVIDIYKPEQAVEIIKEVIGSDLAERSKERLLEARRRVLYEHNVFGVLARVARELVAAESNPGRRRARSLYPEHHFMPLAIKLKRRLKEYIGKLPVIGNALRNILRFLRRQAQHYRGGALSNEFCQKWFSDNPKDELRFQYDLPSGANILDVGGYAGDFAARFIELCNANVTVFEPVSVFASKIKLRFAGDKRVCVHEAGLSDKDEMVDLNLDADESSVFGSFAGRKEQIALWDAERFFRQCETDEWHLAKLNIEGGEYALLSRLIDTDHIKKFKYLQVRFHLNFPGARKQYEKLAERLRQTHKLQWRYPFVWESWERQDEASEAVA